MARRRSGIPSAEKRQKPDCPAPFKPLSLAQDIRAHIKAKMEDFMKKEYFACALALFLAAASLSACSRNPSDETTTLTVTPETYPAPRSRVDTSANAPLATPPSNSVNPSYPPNNTLPPTPSGVIPAPNTVVGGTSTSSGTTTSTVNPTPPPPLPHSTGTTGTGTSSTGSGTTTGTGGIGSGSR